MSPRPRPGSTVRRRAAALLDATRASRQPLDAALETARQDLPTRDGALLRELVLGSLRWLLRLDFVIGEAARRPSEDLDPGLRAPLRVAAYQILALDRIPAHAAVDAAVDEVRRRGLGRAAGFANAVLRRLAERPSWDRWPLPARPPASRWAVEFSHPQWLVERWLAAWGETRTREVLAAGNQPREPGLLCFSDRGGPAAAATALQKEGVTTRPLAIAPLGLQVVAGEVTQTETFRRGDLYIADGASQAASCLPPPAPGERILDLAAAPGGKTFALLAQEPAATVVAADRDFARMLRMRDNTRRLGRQVPLVLADVLAAPWSTGFDRVVADLPCSGTGTLRKHPELKWRLRPGDPARLADAALPLALAAADQVRPGGLLILITCSIEGEENEDLVDRLCVQRPGWQRLELAAVAAPGAAVLPLPGGGWRALPDETHDGFTVHGLRRPGEVA